MSSEPISKPRLWLYWLIALLVVPSVFLLCLEGGLRLAGIGYLVDYTTTTTNKDKEYYSHNPRFVELFFPKKIARQPVFFTYPVEKSSETFRIFILGASAAQGDPAHSYGFSRILNVLLRERFPTLNFEVINTSITATNSHVVRPIAEEVSRHRADLAIIYLGNNEVVGPFGSGNSFTKSSPSLSLIRAGLQVKATRIGQSLSLLLGMLGERHSPQRWKGMEMFLGSQFRADDHALESVYNHYRQNLRDIIEVFREKQIPVILNTVGSNLKDSPPFASQHRSELTGTQLEQWSAAFQQGETAFQLGDYEQALAAYRQAATVDHSYADLQFRIGQSLLRTGQPDRARQAFEQARDQDTLRFRADSRINEIIQDVANEFAGEKFTQLDANALFYQASPESIPGKELFFEHVHMTFHGNYLLAHKVAELVQQHLPREAIDSQTAASFLAEDDCARMLALGPFDRLRVDKLVLLKLQRPPFSNQLGHTELIARLEADYTRAENELTATVLEANDRLYRQALAEALPQRDPWLHYNYANFLKEQGQLSAAVSQIKQFVDLFPESYRGQHELAVLLAKVGKDELEEEPDTISFHRQSGRFVRPH